MKYCHECGTKLEKIKGEHTQITKKKEEVNHKNNMLLKAAGHMVLIAAILSIFIGFAGIGLSQSLIEVDGYSLGGYYYQDSYAYHLYTEKIIAGIFGLFGFISGIISCVSIYTRKMFSLALVGLGVLFTAAAFSAFLGLFLFIMLGLSILIMGTISTVFTCVSRKDFLF